MKRLRTRLVLSALTLVALFAPAARADVIEIADDTYAAVAFSPSTGKYGYAWNHGSRTAAERAALSECKADDAKLVGWVNFGWVVLVSTDDNAYGVASAYGRGATDRDALDRAARELRKHSDKPITTVVIVCSGDLKPRVIKK